MEERENVEILYLGNITHQNENPGQSSDKLSYQDEISFGDPVQIQLIRIPSNGKEMYSRLLSQTQKQPIKSLQIYYRNLDKKSARYSLLVCSSSELLVSSSIDILMTLPETIFTDLLVIRGNFTNITFCIYGRVLRSKQEIQKKCPYFINNIEVLLREEQPSIKMNRNVFNESRSIVKAIEDEYTEAKDQVKLFNWNTYTTDRQTFDPEIKNICKISEQLNAYEDIDTLQQRHLGDIRIKMESMLGYLSKLFKSAHIGLYYPTPYRPSTIPEAIPVDMISLAIKLLSKNLSDQYRTLDVLKLILQLGPHAQYFVNLGGIDALIRLFLQFFCSNVVILSTLKSLILEVFIALSFWNFSAAKLVDKLPNLFQQTIVKSNSQLQKQSNEEHQSPKKSVSKSRSPSRSRDKKKKKSQISPSKEDQKSEKKKSKKQKEKKSKKNKDKERSRSRSRSKDREKQKQKKKEKNRSQEKQKQKEKEREKEKERQKEKEKQKQKEKQKIKKQQKMEEQKVESEEVNLKQKLLECNSFYEIIFILIRYEKNSKLQLLMKIFLQQITQTLTKNVDVSNQMAYYTPLLRDTKYMFNQGGQMINSKSLKVFAFFQPFLNSEQSKGVQSPYVCQSQKIKQPKKYNIPGKLFKLIDTALSTLQSKSVNEAPVMFDEQFMTLISALIQNNKNGTAIGLNNFIQAIRIDTLLGLKKQEAVVAIICEYIHEVFIQDEGMNVIYYLDQIHNIMLKIINWLKEDRTFSIEIKRKVQYLINSALVYNYFSGTQNNFKNFSEYFIKLIGHQNLDINKILDYSRKQQHKTVNPLTFLNLSENFSLGNFYDVLPAQPLLEVDICLRLFLAILKFNKNIWTVFYEYKFVPAFATLYLKLHSLLKFFLTPSLQRQNALVELKMHQRLINNYLQVTKHLTTIFICKWRYESAFNQLTEEQDIFNSVQLYEKWVDTYIFLYNAIHTKDFVITTEKTISRIKDLFSNFIQLFDVIFKGYELTKNNDRQRNLKSLLKFIYRQHYQSITYRSGILSLLSLFLNIAGNHTSEVIMEYLLQKNPKVPNNNYDILLPENEKSIFQNILRRNMYRSDPAIAENIARLIQQLLSHEKYRDKIYDILENILDQNQAHQKEQMEQSKYDSISIEKSTLFTNILSFVKAPMNSKIEQHLLRLLKSTLNIKYPSNQDQMKSFQLRRLKLRNSYLNFFKTALKYNKNFSTLIYQQYLKLVSGFLQAELPQSCSNIRLEQLNGIAIIIEGLQSSCSNLTFQSILLYGQFIEKPTKVACQLSLQKLFTHFKTGFNKHKNNDMEDESQAALIRKIGLSLVYLLCQLTTIDGVEFYSTECRKNALNTLVSPQKNFNLADVLTIMEQIVPKKFILTLKNYLDFPIVEKPQILPLIDKQKSQKKTSGYLYSKGVFTMISENDPIGKARFELIQDKWVGGDIEGELFKVNTPLNYSKLSSQRIIQTNLQVSCVMAHHQDNKLNYVGIHVPKQVNNLFSFKIKKIFTQDTKKNTISANRSILMKNIPPEIKRPEITPKQSYQNKMNTSPSLNRNMQPNPQYNNVSGGNNMKPSVYNPPPQIQQPPMNMNRASSSNNREPSPYTQPIYSTPSKPNYNNSSTYIPPPVTNPAMTNPNPYYAPKNPGIQYNTAPISKPYTPPAYEQPMPVYDPRAYYPPVQSYDPRTGAPYPGSYMVHNPPHPNYPPRVMTQPGYPNPYPPMYVPPRPPQTKVNQPDVVNEAISILMFLQQNPNSGEKEQLKTKVNKLFQIPGVHEKVTRYFEEMKRG